MEMQNRLRQAHSLPETLAELTDLTGQVVFKPGRIHRFRDMFPLAVLRDPAQFCHHQKIRLDREFGIQRSCLRKVSDPGLYSLRVLQHIQAVD